MKFEEKWTRLEAEVTKRGGDGKEFVAAMKEHNDIYKDQLYLWLASLYDKETGGFYYSITGRDNEPFRPDIESTYQAVSLILGSGLLEKAEDFPLRMKENMRILYYHVHHLEFLFQLLLRISIHLYDGIFLIQKYYLYQNKELIYFHQDLMVQIPISLSFPLR